MFSDADGEGSDSAGPGLPTVGVWGDVAGGGNPAAPPDNTANVGDIQSRTRRPSVADAADGKGRRAE